MKDEFINYIESYKDDLSFFYDKKRALTSNEFILGVKDDAHPFMLYRQAGVPTVLSTDDPGILRTNLTQQYVLAAMRYGLSYYDIKNLFAIVFASALCRMQKRRHC